MELFSTEIYTDLLISLFGREPGSTGFYIIAGATLGIFVILGRVLVGLFRGSAGLIKTLIGLVIPLALGFVLYAATALYLVPLVEADWADVYLPWAGMIVGILLVLIFISPRIFGTGKFVTILIFILSGVAGGLALIGTDRVLEMFDRSTEQVEKRERRIERETAPVR